MQSHVADVLFHKGHQVYCVQPDATVRSAVDTMARHNVGALIVLSAHGHVIGILSERDVLWRIVHESRPAETLVIEVMAQDPILVSPDMRVSDAMRIMTERRVRHLPVVDRERRLVGLISIGDLTKWVTHDLETHAVDLASYICGGSRVEIATIME
jgi:CBS domain-containing protein